MKRGTYAVLPVQIGIDLDTVERVRFVFEQDACRMVMEWPSARCVRREGENIIDLLWTQADTFAFEEGEVEMDTHITLKDAETNPETGIVAFFMSPTLFELREVVGHD